jgi:hypothetical protein
MPHPKMYLSVRGGTTKVPHGQRDLLSFQCVVGNEALISNCKGGGYLDTTFSSRREDLFEIGPWSKNTLFINGVGICANSSLDSTTLSNNKTFPALRMDASSAFGSMRDGNAADFCGRLVIMLTAEAYVIIDRFDLPQLGRVESRLHSYATVNVAKQGARIKGKRASLRLSYAASIPALLVTATTAPTFPAAPSAQQLRWCSVDLHKTHTFATLITAGAAAAGVSVSEQGNKIHVDAVLNGKKIKLSCTRRLTNIGRR